MTITYHNSASTPADNGSQAGSGPVAVTPPASMVTGDLVLMVAQGRTTGGSLSLSATGGQSWTTEAQIGNTNITGRLFWCRYNGTWGADPSVTSGDTNGLSVTMHVFRPTDSAKVWAIDVAQTELDFTAPSTPFTVTITGLTTVADSTVTFAAWMTADDNTWGTLAGTGWVVTGAAQYRNLTGQDQSCTFAHNIRTTAGSVANVSKNQATLGGDAGTTLIIAFTEQDAPTGPSPGLRTLALTGCGL